MTISPQLSAEVDKLLAKSQEALTNITNMPETSLSTIIADVGKQEIIIKTKDIDLLMKQEIVKRRV